MINIINIAPLKTEFTKRFDKQAKEGNTKHSIVKQTQESRV